MPGSKTRDTRIVAAVRCPRCGAAAGEPCRNPVPHNSSRGPDDRRKQPVAAHNERRMAWIEHKQLRGVTW